MISLVSLVAILAVGSGLLMLRVAVVLRKIRQRQQYEHEQQEQKRSMPIRTVVVLGSGGHTTEMLQLLQSLNPKYYRPLTFIVAQTDTTSMKRVQAWQTSATAAKKSTTNDDHDKNASSLSISIQPDSIYYIPRSREVGQSYVTSIGTTIWSLMYTLGIMLQVRPGLLLCNGPGTCLPIAIWTFVGRILGLWEGTIVFCESFCRVTSLSLTGKLLYPVADLFVVHWEQLQRKYPRSRLVTTFVPRSVDRTKAACNSMEGTMRNNSTNASKENIDTTTSD